MDDLQIARKLWDHTRGHAWEPKGGTSHPTIQRLVKSGFLKVVDGRCGFERIKDAMVSWTPAGRAALEANSND